MSKPEWRTIIESQLGSNPQCNVYALSTVEDGAPRVRHVVHRGFTPTNLLLASTDLRMPKAAQIRHDSNVESAWLFMPAFVQVRVRGRAYTYPSPGSGLPAHTSGGEDEWKAAWDHLFHTATSPYLRATFARPAVPGSRLAEAPDTKTWPVVLPDETSNEQDAQALALAKRNFAILIIEPLRVEVLDLKKSPHERVEWVLSDGAWVKEELVP